MTYQAPEIFSEHLANLLASATVAKFDRLNIREDGSRAYGKEIRVDCGPYFKYFDALVFSGVLSNIPDDLIRGARLVDGMRQIAENAAE